MTTKRAVITGLGAVTPAGTGWKETWQALVHGPSAIRHIHSFDPTRFRTRIAGEAAGFEPQKFISEKLVDSTERFTQLAIAAAQLAIDDSGFRMDSDTRDIGLVIGCGMGGLPYFEQQAERYVEKGPSVIRPGSVPRIMPNAAAFHIAAQFKIRGPNTTLSTACSSGNHAVGYSLDLIRSGRCRAVICGGTESLLSPITFGAFDNLHVMSKANETPKKACRPFDRSRDGFVMSEGAVLFMVEELAHAKARGANVYAEIAGYGASGGIHNILASEPDGREISDCMSAALKDAGEKPDSVQYIHAHGTATISNDVTETLAIKTTFGDYAKKLLVSSTKAVTGHMIAAAGAMGVLVCALSIQQNLVPPTLNLENPDPICDLDYVPGHARKRQVNLALSNAFGFGSNNATIVIKAAT